MLVASSIWENACPTKRTCLTIINPFFDAIYMENMLATIKLVKLVIHALHKLVNADTALLSFQLFGVTFR
jgi:hypothetical protein